MALQHTTTANLERYFLTMNEHDILTNLHELTDDQRLDAKDNARAVLLREIGNNPKRADYTGNTISEYPGWVRVLVAALMGVVFIAAAMPSLFRLYAAGSSYHMDAVGVSWQAAIVGVATFLLAEFLIITSTLAASIFFTGRQRAAFAIPVLLGLAVAFVGNWTVVQPHDLFAWLETTVPPLAVLVMSFVGERLILDSVRQQHADEQAYQQALADWQAERRDIEHHARFQVVYGRALVDALRDANGSGTGAKNRREFMSQMNRRAWAVLVRREWAIERGEWLNTPEPATVQYNAPQVAPGGETDPKARHSGSYPTTPDAPGNTQIMPPVSVPTVSANGHGPN